MNEKEKAFDEVFSKLSLLEDLFNNDFVTLLEYWKIKNRIIERLIEVKKYYDDINAEK